jgi:thiaminase/transcriptional activator TenA
MSFSQRMWAEVAGLYRQILELPFNRELAAGTLARERFVHYVIQDAHYLACFSRALAASAARAPDARGQVLLSHCAHDAIVVERALHESFFADFGIGEAEWQASPPSPTCFAYGHWLVSAAHVEPWAAALGALLPCFWIYHEVGRHLHGIAADPNPYRKWIDTYADEAFARTVREVAALTDAAHDAASPAEREAMAANYLMATRLEWLFWDAAYRLERWPV